MATALELQRRYSSTKLQSLGRDLHAQGRYDEAIEALSAAVDSSTGKAQLLALAARASAYEKSDRSSQGLKDGKKLMELDTKGTRGYLVTGRILRQMKKNDLAQKVYQRGLRFCTDQTERKKLLAYLTELSGGTDGANGSDPVVQLPTELLEMILSYLPFQTLCIAFKVSKTWREQLATLPSLWTTADFSLAKKPVRPQDLM